MDEHGGVEKREGKREEIATVGQVSGEQVQRAKMEAINIHLEQRFGGAVGRGWIE